MQPPISAKCKNVPYRELYNPKLPPNIYGNFETTNQRDYKRYCDAVRTRITYEQKRFEDPPKVVSVPYHREDQETYAKFRPGAEVPIELFSTPKPIIRTNPHVPFKELGEPPRVKTEEAIKTRPRRYFVPGIPVDDIKEKDKRDLICRYMYTTQGRRAEREATVYFKPIKPRIDKIETSDEVTLKIDWTPPLGEKFRKVCREWDHEQERDDPDVTREFWTHKDPPVVCGACVDPYKNIVAEDTKRTLASLVEKERLAGAHDKKPGCTYTGHKPRLPLGIRLEKKQLSTLHPLLSVPQVQANRTPEEVKELACIYQTEFADKMPCATN
ncbi:unnamed protein product [Phyllotreta striolata]|uniref:Uncharacterized protein n=1 Tax=Phyllotreta striolata TaxID=444603 RepID=A0A9P0DN07_PHYSR|nr:unnamed protein product [Phyllotreta striolata]